MLASHGLPYTMADVRAMSLRDRSAMTEVIREMVIERDRARATEEARQQALGGLSQRQHR